MRWGERRERSGVLERRFDVDRAGRDVPGILWSSPSSARGPLVLIGHGGSGSVLDDHVVSLARRLVRDHGLICMAIEGPVHGVRRGERSDDPRLVLLDFSQAWATDAAMTDEMVADWRAALGAVVGEFDLDGAPVGYWGLSMGTILGLPLVVAEDRIDACVLGLAGIAGPTEERLARDAPSLVCPTMFVMQWDDELFERSTSFALFDALGSRDKQLHAAPGTHSAVNAESFDLTIRFLIDRLSKGR